MGGSCGYCEGYVRLNPEVEIGVRFKLCHFGIEAGSGLDIEGLD